jgi:hypothetical protein
MGAEVAVGAAVPYAPLAWACCLVAAAAAADAVDATDPAWYGARLWAAGSTPVNLTGRRSAHLVPAGAPLSLDPRARADWKSNNEI